MMKNNKLLVSMLGMILVAGIFVGCGATEPTQESGVRIYPENMGFELVYESPRV